MSTAYRRMYGVAPTNGYRPGSAPQLPSAAYDYGSSTSAANGLSQRQPPRPPTGSPATSPRYPHLLPSSYHDGRPPAAGRAGPPDVGPPPLPTASSTGSAYDEVREVGPTIAAASPAGWDEATTSPMAGPPQGVELDVDLFGFRLHVLDPVTVAPPYCLRGALERHVFTSEWAYPGLGEEAVEWCVRPHFRYGPDARARETGVLSTGAGSTRPTLVLECYGGGGGTLVGRCVVPLHELLPCPADHPTQLTLRAGRAVTGVLSFYPVLTRVERLTLVVSNVVLTPNPLPLLFPDDGPGRERGVNASSTLCLAIVPPPPPGTGRRSDPPAVPPSFQSARGVEWASLPPLAVSTTPRELVSGGGLECRLYAVPAVVSCAASTGPSPELCDLVYVGRFTVRPALGPVAGGRGVGTSRATFHAEVELVPAAGGSAGAHPTPCWARGTVERLADRFAYPQSQAASRGGRDDRPSGAPALLRPSPPHRSGVPAVVPEGRADLSSSWLTTSAGGQPHPGSPVAVAEPGSELQVAEQVLTQQAELVEHIRGRLQVVRERRAAMHAALARVRGQEEAEMRAAAETRGRLESDRAQCAAQLRALEEQLAAVRERRAAVASEAAARGAERRAAAARAAEERAELVRIRGRLEGLQREMQRCLEVEEGRYSARVEAARAAGVHAERTARWLTEVEAKLAAAGAPIAADPQR